MKQYKILSLGDSYTIGEAVEPKDRFINQFVRMLMSERVLFSEPVVIAKTGWTTDELSVAIKDSLKDETFDFVTLLIGVNNQYRSRAIDNYTTEFVELLKTAIRFTGGDATKVFVLSIPDWGVTPFGHKDKRGPIQIGEEIDAFNEVNKLASEQMGANYVDITPISKLAQNDLSLIASDGLHPSENMYALWAEKLREKFLSVIAE